MTVKKGVSDGIVWREWSKQTFEEARSQNKLILLDLTATWCHWCHVMDENTYANESIARQINDNFIPIRVDIDKRPDISDRYNRGGFPTTAFLSDMGESVWGATYIPPIDMQRVIESIIKAKASGEIDQALERSRLHYLDISKAREVRRTIDSKVAENLFEDIFAVYDVENGGFGSSPKFPHPDVVELMISRYAQNGDEELSEAIVRTLDRMAEGLYDKVEGGIFRYSVTRDWREPHYEKMLETNLGFLRNLAHAHKVLGRKNHDKLARGVADYLIRILRDHSSGGFYGSQDADEEYYRLDMRQRSRRSPPSIDRTVYAGWNSEAISTLIYAGTLLGVGEWMESARSAWDYSVKQLWNPDINLVRHAKGQDIYLFDDQVSFLESLLSVLELQADESLLEIGRSLVDAVDAAFANPEGGHSDVAKSPDAIGELDTPRRSLASNSKWATAIALYGAASHDPSLETKARETLRSFTVKDAEAHGLFAAAYVSSWLILEKGPMLVEVHSPPGTAALGSPLWMAAKDSMNPAAVVVLATDARSDTETGAKPFAIVCDKSGCSNQVIEPKSLSERLSH